MFTKEDINKALAGETAKLQALGVQVADVNKTDGDNITKILSNTGRRTSVYFVDGETVQFPEWEHMVVWAEPTKFKKGDGSTAYKGYCMGMSNRISRPVIFPAWLLRRECGRLVNKADQHEVHANSVYSLMETPLLSDFDRIKWLSGKTLRVSVKEYPALKEDGTPVTGGTTLFYLFEEVGNK